MKWDDTGLILSLRKHGDNSLILSVLTKTHGRHSGFIRNKITKKNSFIYQIGNLVSLNWNGRLEDHLGYFKCELIKSYSLNFYENPINLYALNAFCEMQNNLLPEREMCKNLYEESVNFIKIVNSNNLNWLHNYIKWELFLLSELGYGIDLSCCAVTGSKTNLNYVSPKSGRAISENAAGNWRNRLLKLPNFLINSNDITLEKNNVLDGINLTGHFLKKYLYNLGLKLPESRDRFINELLKIDFE